MSHEKEDSDLRADIAKAHEDWRVFYNELTGQSSRAAAIVAVSGIESEIEIVLKRCFPADVDPKLWKTLFGPGGNASSLLVKTRFIEAFGLFGPVTTRTIAGLAKIRNKFAHSPEIHQFTHPKILSLCIELRNNPFCPFDVSESSPESKIRAYYVGTALSLHRRLESTSPKDFGLEDPLGPMP